MTEEAPVAEDASVAAVPPDNYWLRVYGYAEPIKEDLIAYGDFFDPRVGRLADDPCMHLHPGDVILYYADGPASLFGVGIVQGPVQGPFANGSEGQHWQVAIKAEAVILTMNKAPHAGGLTPPSGWNFLQAVREYTFIRLPDEDGPYLVQQVKSRASTRGE